MQVHLGVSGAKLNFEGVIFHDKQKQKPAELQRQGEINLNSKEILSYE